MLGAIRYQPNRAVLHTDTRVMPRRSRLGGMELRARSQRRAGVGRVCLHYWLNRLQPLAVCRSRCWCRSTRARPSTRAGAGEFDYDHPVFDLPAIAAQKQVPLLQGAQHTWFAGAWTGYGFHEDGLRSATAPPICCCSSCAGREAC